MVGDVAAVGRRELTRAHITFYRAVMEGVDLAKAWDLYLQLDGDYSEAGAKAMAGWVRRALIQEALATGQAALIGLFRREPWRVKTSPKPTLAEFAARFSDAGDFSESELLEMWAEEFGGKARAEARRERLSRRLRQALQLLEGATRRQPRREDLVGTWLVPQLATRLAAAGLETLGAVRDALGARKTSRWDEIPGVGEVWADRLEKWFESHGLPLVAVRSGLPAAASSLLVPLERLTLPNRYGDVDSADEKELPAVPPSPSVRSSIHSIDDKQAIELWLETKAQNAHTYRVYRRSAERLLLWCAFERGRRLRDLSAVDAESYRKWLLDLGRQGVDDWSALGWRLPAEAWIGPRAAQRNSPEWRPFEGPLSEASVAHDLRAVRALFEFLVRERLLRSNPFGSRAARDQPASNASVKWKSTVRGGGFTAAEWSLVASGVEGDVSDELGRRLRLVLWLGYACGLTASEMVSLRLGSLVAEPEWRIVVIGRNGTARQIPLAPALWEMLVRYLESVGVPLDAVQRVAHAGGSTPEREAPLLRSRKGRRRPGGPAPTQALTYAGLYSSVKAYLTALADGLDEHEPAAAQRLRLASTQWLRSSFARKDASDGLGRQVAPA